MWAAAPALHKRGAMSRAYAPPEDKAALDKTSAGHSLRRNLVFAVVFVMVVALQLILAEAYQTPKLAASPSPTITGIRRSPPTVAPTLNIGIFDSPLGSSSSSSSVTSVGAAAAAAAAAASASIAVGEDTVDVNALEEQLNALDDLQQSLSNETVTDDGIPLPPPPPASMMLSSSGGGALGLGASSNEAVPLPPASGAAAAASEHSDHHKHHSTTHRHCRSRSALFKSATSLPALVNYPVLSRHHSASKVESVWRRAFAKAGFQETDKPELATYLVSKQSLDARLPFGESCPDTQMFNHIRGLRVSLVDPIAMARTDATPGVSLAAYWGSATTSSSARKAQCSSFMVALSEQLSSAGNGSTADVWWAWTERKESSTSRVLSRLTLKDLRKLLDGFRKSGTCPHHDDVVVSRRFADLVFLDDRPCALRTFLFVASAKPVLAFLASKNVLLQCDDSLDFANAELLSTSALQERIERGGRAVGALWAEYHLPHQMRRAAAEAVRHSKGAFDPGRGRFALLAADFVLERSSLRPMLWRVVDHPDLPDIPAVLEVVLEAIRALQVLVKAQWNARPLWQRPEALSSVLDSFGLIGFEPEGGEAAEGSFYPF